MMAEDRDTAKIKENVVSNNRVSDCPKYGIRCLPGGDDMNTVTTTDLLDWLHPAKRARMIEDVRVKSMFRGRDHARQVWDDWDGISTEGEDAHRYLNLIGDGAYCAV